MNGNHVGRQPVHQVFAVDGRNIGQMRRPAPPPPPPSYPPRMEPGLVPCWTFPPARERRRSWAGNSSSRSGLVIILVMLLVLVFAGLGLGAYQIQNLQKELQDLKGDENKHSHIIAPQGQIGLREDFHEEPKSVRIAAHLTVNSQSPVHDKTLQWKSKYDGAFTKGVLYRDGGLQVNRTGLYFVYSQVELLGNDCFQGSFLHQVFVQRSKPVILMEGHKESHCKQAKKQVWTSNSYLGAVLELQQNDWVYVNVSHPKLINPSDPYGIFFGLYDID